MLKMTKLKCWKKIGKMKFKNSSMNKTLIIEKTDEPEYDYKYLVYFTGWKWNGSPFKSKPQALKFAKNYMKEHDKCQI